MNDLLKNRLEECNINIHDIENNISKSVGELSIFIYTSHLEGLGTKDSDFDIYIVCEKAPNDENLIDKGKYKLSSTLINSTFLDIEYWSISNIIELINKVNSNDSNNIDLEELKLLHRLRISEIIGNNDIFNIKSKIKNSFLQKKILNYYKLQANSFLEDAVYMYNSNEFVASFNCSFKALDAAIGAFNAKNGITNLKGKWRSKLFLDQSINDKSILDSYFKYQIFTNITNDNISDFLEEKIEFIQNILSRVTL